MKTKQLFKRILSWSLAGAAALSLTVFAHAETATAAEAPVAANMVGKTFTADGKRTPEEGWTEVPTLVADSQKDLQPVKTWIGTDGNYLYYFVEISKAYTQFNGFEIQIDYLNTDSEKKEDGSAKYTDESYREKLLELGKTTPIGQYSVWSFFDFSRSENSKYYHAHPYGEYKKGSSGCSGLNNEWGYIIGDNRRNAYDSVNDIYSFELRVSLPSYIQDSLKTGTYTIGAESVADSKSPYQQIAQYSEGVLSDSNTSDGGNNHFIEPARLRDVVLPCTASAVGELIGYQIAAMTEGYSVRFLSTLEGTDYTEYAEVGFRFELNGKTVEKSCRSVYHTVLANYGAEQVRANTYGATYLYACTVEGLSATETYAFTVTPWTLKAGETEKTCGTPCAVTIQSGAAVTK